MVELDDLVKFLKTLKGSVSEKFAVELQADLKQDVNLPDISATNKYKLLELSVGDNVLLSWYFNDTNMISNDYLYYQTDDDEDDEIIAYIVKQVKDFIEDQDMETKKIDPKSLIMIGDRVNSKIFSQICEEMHKLHVKDIENGDMFSTQIRLENEANLALARVCGYKISFCSFLCQLFGLKSNVKELIQEKGGIKKSYENGYKPELAALFYYSMLLDNELDRLCNLVKQIKPEDLKRKQDAKEGLKVL